MAHEALWRTKAPECTFQHPIFGTDTLLDYTYATRSSCGTYFISAPRSALCTEFCNLCTFIEHNFHFGLPYDLEIAHCTLHTAHCTLHTAHCTLHNARVCTPKIVDSYSPNLYFALRIFSHKKYELYRHQVYIVLYMFSRTSALSVIFPLFINAIAVDHIPYMCKFWA